MVQKYDTFTRNITYNMRREVHSYNILFLRELNVNHRVHTKKNTAAGVSSYCCARIALKMLYCAKRTSRLVFLIDRRMAALDFSKSKTALLILRTRLGISLVETTISRILIDSANCSLIIGSRYVK